MLRFRPFALRFDAVLSGVEGGKRPESAGFPFQKLKRQSHLKPAGKQSHIAAYFLFAMR